MLNVVLLTIYHLQTYKLIKFIENSTYNVNVCKQIYKQCLRKITECLVYKGVIKRYNLGRIKKPEATWTILYQEWAVIVRLTAINVRGSV